MLRLENIKIREDLSEEEVVREACRKYQISFSDVEYYNIFKKSIDARNKDDIFYNYTIDVKYIGKSGKNIKKVSKETFDVNVNIKRKSELRPVIVGAGPAGLFCALILVENGIKPIVIEQGKTVEGRKKDVETFFETGKLVPNSNGLFSTIGLLIAISLISKFSTLISASLNSLISFKSKISVSSLVYSFIVLSNFNFE